MNTKMEALGLTIFVVFYSTAVYAQQGALPDPNPWVGLPGAATMHGDTASSDATYLIGPGRGGVRSSYKPLFGACSTVLVRHDGRLFVLCTSWTDRAPVIRLLESNSAPLARMKLSAGSLLGGVYAYLDNEDRLVMVDGQQNLIRVGAEKKKRILTTRWRLAIEVSVPLGPVVTGHCGGSNCDAVVSISPDGDGGVWFASREGLVGIYNPTNGSIAHILLAENESIHNSFSTTNDGRAAIATDHALYLMRKDELGRPAVLWRYEYSRGSARKPGQLSYGTGATPTFFGPAEGTEFVTITDNADEQMNLLVLDAKSEYTIEEEDNPTVICQIGLFGPDASGTENSAIGIGRSIFVASTYGYPYPALPEGAGPSFPEQADFAGGMARVDIDPENTGCDLVWQNNVRSSAVPKLSVTDQLIYTIESKPLLAQNNSNLLDIYSFTVIDAHTGQVLQQTPVGRTVFRNPLQMAGNIGYKGVYWQGTLGGLLRIEAD